MLGAILRVVFLIGILTWYSSSVWRLIDGYFKDQFRHYLEEEYRKNPKMRQDVKAAAAGNSDSSSTTTPPVTTVAPLESILEACQQADTCPAKAAESKLENEENGTNQVVPDATGENGASVESTDKNAFRETAGSQLESSDHKEQPPIGERVINHRDDSDIDRKSHINEDRAQPTIATVTGTPSSSTEFLQTSKKNAAKQVKRTGGESVKRSKKRKVKTIFLTEEDFANTKSSKITDDDFWEFEEDAEEKGAPKGILVSHLPFKPRIDIGELERVTEDEFCPLTLDDEGACGEAVPWP